MSTDPDTQNTFSVVLRTLQPVCISALAVTVIDLMFLKFGKNMTFQIALGHVGSPNGILLPVVVGGGGGVLTVT